MSRRSEGIFKSIVMETLKEEITSPVIIPDSKGSDWGLEKVKETLQSENFRLMEDLSIRFVFHQEKTDHKIYTRNGKLVYYGNWQPIKTSLRSVEIIIRNRQIIEVNTNVL